jgi:hypothetical protein
VEHYFVCGGHLCWIDILCLHGDLRGKTRINGFFSIEYFNSPVPVNINLSLYYTYRIITTFQLCKVKC